MNIDDLTYALAVDWIGIPSANFNSSEVDMIVNKIKNHKRTSIGINEIFFVLQDGHITISKKEDEWFYVEISSSGLPSKYFKCDQIDGLLKLLDDLSL